MKFVRAVNRLGSVHKLSRALPVNSGNSFSYNTTTMKSSSAAPQVKNHQELHAPVGEDGKGEYSAATKGCFDVINRATPLVLESVKRSKITNDQPFTVADYGTADGGTSLGLLTKVVQAVREKSPDQEIVLAYEDQAINEWKSVFKHALGDIPVSDAYGETIPTPYALKNVFVQACGVGFHTQCFASKTIDLGVSFTAMHWLSASPNSLKGRTEMHAVQCADKEDLPEKAQAAKDWNSILQARANEMKPGARMVLVNFCCSKEGYFLGHTNTGVSMWDSFAHSWNKLHDQGLIDETELKGVSFPSYYRTSGEFLAGAEAVPGLKVVSCEEHVVPCPYRELWNAGQATGIDTPKQYAEWFVPTTRTWSHSTFQSALHPDRPDKVEVMNQFWQNYMDLVETDPDNHGMDYVHNYLVLEKES